MSKVNLPDRPKGFYRNWETFCQETVSHLVTSNPDGRLPVILLGAGALLGASGLVALIAANSDYIDEKGKEWGIDALGTLAMSGGGIIGAALGGIGGAMVTRLLSRYADADEVDNFQSKLEQAQQEFETLGQDLDGGFMKKKQHRREVERLFLRLTED